MQYCDCSSEDLGTSEAFLGSVVIIAGMKLVAKTPQCVVGC